jgi:hypothetical protein
LNPFPLYTKDSSNEIVLIKLWNILNYYVHVVISFLLLLLFINHFGANEHLNSLYVLLMYVCLLIISKIFMVLWSQVRASWLLIWWLLEAYMVVNFRARRISKGACKLAWIPTLIKKKSLWCVDENRTFLGYIFTEQCMCYNACVIYSLITRCNEQLPLSILSEQCHKTPKITIQ